LVIMIGNFVAFIAKSYKPIEIIKPGINRCQNVCGLFRENL
jgi:hypothetical protein